MTAFPFECPHCGQPTEVGLESLDRPALCTACAMPYRAEIPKGQLLIKDGDAGLRPAADESTPADHNDQTILTVNPAAFRDRPIQTLVLVLLTFAGLIGLLMFASEASEGIGMATLTALSALVALGASVMLAGRFAMTRFESLTVTTQRSIWARGVINRQSSEVQHDDIRNIQVQQNLVERLVGAGTIAISSAGQDDMEIIAEGIPNPHRVIDTIRTHQRRLVKPD